MTDSNSKNEKLNSSVAELVRAETRLARQNTYIAELEAELDTCRDALKHYLRLEVHPAPTLDALLNEYDADFIRCAYLTILGREPDDSGFEWFLGKLRNGMPKMRVIEALCLSPEGEQRQVSLPGLKKALKRQRLRRNKIAGRILSLPSPAEETTRRKVERLEVMLGKMQANLNLHLSVSTGLDKSVSKKRNPVGKLNLLVDVSGIVQRDAKTGVQRVVRCVLSHLLLDPPEGFDIEPVYTPYDGTGYYYADASEDPDTGDLELTPLKAALEPREGDIFLGLDYHRVTTARELPYYTYLRMRGVEVYFILHDLLPILRPEFFTEGEAEEHAAWVRTLAELDGVVCVSRTVADETAAWLDKNGPTRTEPFRIGWSHNGADFENAKPSTGRPGDADETLAKIAERPTFLMVGTIEPRKGHKQTLAAFEKLWADGVDVNLVIVGRVGWNVDELAERLRGHEEIGKRLFFMDQGISDAYLDELYAAATCLLAPSEGEGFGLPLIEAARHDIPLLVRDMPVFREVAGEHAYYFSGLDGADLAAAVTDWLALYEKGAQPTSDGLRGKSWEQSTKRLTEIIIHGDWYREWNGKTPPAANAADGGDDGGVRDYKLKETASGGT